MNELQISDAIDVHASKPQSLGLFVWHEKCHHRCVQIFEESERFEFYEFHYRRFAGYIEYGASMPVWGKYRSICTVKFDSLTLNPAIQGYNYFKDFDIESIWVMFPLPRGEYLLQTSLYTKIERKREVRYLQMQLFFEALVYGVDDD